MGWKVSSVINVEGGVLQGESLSPLLFCIFLNDLEDFFTSKKVEGVSITAEECTDVTLNFCFMLMTW